MNRRDVEEQIQNRWEASADQIEQTVEAIRVGSVHVANDETAIARRQNRLKRQGLRLEGIVNEDWRSSTATPMVTHTSPKSEGDMVVVAGTAGALTPERRC
jgi:hypothetical protein